MQPYRSQQFAGEILRDEDGADDEPAGDVAEGQLQERQVAAGGVGLAGTPMKVSVLVPVATTVKHTAHHGTDRLMKMLRGAGLPPGETRAEPDDEAQVETDDAVIEARHGFR